MKRTISFILTICMLLAMAPMGIVPVNAGSYGSLTEEDFAQKVTQMMEQYPHGKFWNQYNGVDSEGIALAGDKICSGYNRTTGKKCTTHGYCGYPGDAGCTCDCGTFNKGWQCHGFANLMAHKFFGGYAIRGGVANSSKGWTYSTSVKEYYAGDFVRINGNHSIFIYKVEGDTVTFVDCNNTNKPCQIDWYKTMSVSKLKSKTNYVVHLKGNTLKGTGKSNNDNPETCECSEKYAGTYVCTTVGLNLNIRSGHGQSYDAIGKIPPGATVTVTKASGTSASDWAHVTYNGISGYATMEYLEKEKVTYTISYDANGGTGAPAKQTKEQGVNLKLSTKKPTRDGYTFLGWSTDASATKATYQPGDTFKTDKKTTLYAVWKKGCENNDHSYDYSEVKAPTTTSTGVLKGTCTRCDKTIEETIPALNEKDYHYLVKEEPTCTKDGTGCYTYSEISYKVFVTLPKTGHNLQETAAAVAATCETAGKAAVMTCVNCGKSEGGEEIPAKGHSYKDGVCSACGKANSSSVLTFALNETGNGYVVTACDPSASGKLVIPATHNGKPVTGIGNSAFGFCNAITSITIPNSVVSIGTWAFAYCDQLTSINIPNGVTELGYYMFYCNFALTDITIPNSVTAIGDYAFSECRNLVSIQIPGSVTRIGESAFDGCNSLTDVTIGNGVTSIGNTAFAFCTNLTDITIPASVAEIGECVFLGCENLRSLQVAKGNSVYHSAGNCIIETASKTLVIGCNISKIPADGSVTAIGKSAFENCYGLTSITIPNGIITVGESAFHGCEDLTSIQFPDSLTGIGEGAFHGCEKLVDVTVGNSIASIGDYAFYDCRAMKAFQLPDGIQYIGKYAFCDCESLTSIVIPGSVSYIGDYAFLHCAGLTNASIYKGVTEIGEGSFFGCTGLSSVAISNSVTRIGSRAFEECESLATVIYCGVREQWDDIEIGEGNDILEDVALKTHDDKNDFCILCKDENSRGFLFYELNEAGDGYVVVECDLSVRDKLVIPATYNGLPVTAIGETAFHSCVNLTEVVIPDSVTRIEWGAFQDCNGLTDITIPDSVTFIGVGAFARCTSLTSITIPKGIAFLHKSLFMGCTSLTSITIPDNINFIAFCVFQDCENLTTVSLPASITGIEESVFEGCSSLETVIYCGTQEQWNEIVMEEGNEPLTDATLRFHDYKNGTCAICGEGSGAAGDIDGDSAVTQDDAVTLLLHTMFGDKYYPLEKDRADIDGNGKVNQEDVVYLLLHTMFGEKYFPLKKD